MRPIPRFTILVEPDADDPTCYHVTASGVRGGEQFTIETRLFARNAPAFDAVLVEEIRETARAAIPAARGLAARAPGVVSPSGAADDRCLTCNKERGAHLGKRHPFEVAS